MYKTILVHADLSVHAPARMRWAATLAHAHGAHLVGAAMLGVSRTILPHGCRWQPGSLEASYFEPLADSARSALSRFSAIAGEAAVSCEARLVCDTADDGLARQARSADLVVISQDDPDESAPGMGTRLPEYVILNSARPVLVVPRTDPAPALAPRILVGWDGSKEASGALAAALPLLQRALAVVVVGLTLPQRGGQDAWFEADQQELSGFLHRHGVSAHFCTREERHGSGRDLLALAQEMDCGLLVMGCFGHSRFHELCVGGATRTILADATLPVLLAH
ncbi:universal stress protein [Massilia oculi]|uniref:Universal stress protein n=1 Tax=Massilia oculi TaxID=945844 RepID=A0A2S2DNP5_9BURK|nr:universal stress protein [Massilia oculi]AWL07000.1 universal stress protein [Massilia oculi]